MDNFNLKKFLVENKLTANSRLLNEAAIETGPEDNLESIKFPNGEEYRVGEDDPNDIGTIIQIQKYPNGYFITSAVYDDPHDYYYDPKGETAKEAYGYALDLAGNEMDEDDLERSLAEKKLTTRKRTLKEEDTQSSLKRNFLDAVFNSINDMYKAGEIEEDVFDSVKDYIEKNNKTLAARTSENPSDVADELVTQVMKEL